MIFVDLELSKRLERTEAHANAMYVEARHRLEPDLGATWIDVEGTYAMFDGVSSPLTQSFGFGLFAEPNQRSLDALEEFFRDRDAPVYHEVSPLSASSHLTLLSQRHYRPIELTSILFRSVGSTNSDSPGRSKPSVQVERLRPGSSALDARLQLWAEINAWGWAPEQPEIFEFVKGIGAVVAAKQEPLCFLASIDGVPAGAAGMHIHQGVALLAGASTLPEHRRCGVQFALLASRLDYAREAGCDLVMMGALPGSPSQRNAERHGFRIAYTRTKWALSVDA